MLHVAAKSSRNVVSQVAKKQSLFDTVGGFFAVAAYLLFPLHTNIANINVSAGDISVLFWCCIQIFNASFWQSLSRILHYYGPFLIAVLLSLLYSFIFFERDIFRLKVSGIELLKLGAFVAWGAMTLHEVARSDTARLKVLLGAMLVFSPIALGHAAVAIAQGGAFRMRWPYENPNIFGNYCVFCFYMFIVAARAGVWWVRSFKWAWIGLALFGLAASGSRGAFGNILVAAVTLCVGAVATGNFRIPKKRILRLAVPILAAIVIGTCVLPYIINSPIVQKRFNQTVAIEGPKNLDIRKLLWNEALFLFQTSPVFGIGYGQFQVESGYSIGIGKLGVGMVTHNIYLSYLAEMGVVGLACFLVVMYKTLKKSLRVATVSRDLTPVIIASILVGCLAQGFFANVDNYRTFSIALGLLFSFRYKGTYSPLIMQPLQRLRS